MNTADVFRLTIAQLDAVVGDIQGNAEKAAKAWEIGKKDGADLVALPEMFLPGYQTHDLILRPSFAHACMDAARALAARCAEGPALLIGGPLLEEGALYNAAWLLEGGEVRTVIRKCDLPNTGVFDEKRLFKAGPPPGPISINGVRVGAPICEDAWGPDVVETLEESGAEILVVLNGSPYERGKYEDRRVPIMVARVIESGLPLAYVNLVGAQDDQMFDGGSFVLNPGGGLAAQAPFFEEAVRTYTFRRGENGFECETNARSMCPGAWEADYRVMVETTRGYFEKNGFKEALIGLSGGVDSALVAAIASDAIGPENVRCVMLPSRYTSEESLEDAADCARRLGVRLDTLPIARGVETLEAELEPFFAGLQPNETEENLQSRLRGLYLMALSNKTGALLLTTGNKSEMAVGYATLYGDMCGAYNPLKDLYKTRVFETCRWRNAHHSDWMRGPEGMVIPARIIEKPPSAELRADQKDEDSLPPYEILDGVLEQLIEHDRSVEDAAAMGYDRAMTARIARLLNLAEYKRFQSPLGTKLTTRAFWLDRRYPITNRWREE